MKVHELRYRGAVTECGSVSADILAAIDDVGKKGAALLVELARSDLRADRARRA
jgi:hypothetical protein